jgi:mRNA interferase RelE/StbE
MAHRIVRAVAAYAVGDGAHANQVKLLKGSATKRLRVGDFRVVFLESDTEVYVVRIAPRGEVYDREDKMPQTIKTSGGETMVVLSQEEYEDLVDARDGNFAAWQLATGQLETFSQEEVMASLAAPSRVAFYRAHRGVAPATLAAAAGISEAKLAEIEAGALVAEPEIYAKLAAHLRTAVGDLMPRTAHRTQGAEAAE